MSGRTLGNRDPRDPLGKRFWRPRPPGRGRAFGPFSGAWRMLPRPSFRVWHSLPLYRRALAYYRPDRRLLVTLLTLIAVSIALGLLQAWPTAVLIDAVLTHSPKSDFFHRLFLFALPKSKLAQVV